MATMATGSKRMEERDRMTTEDMELDVLRSPTGSRNIDRDLEPLLSPRPRAAEGEPSGWAITCLLLQHVSRYAIPSEPSIGTE